MTDDNEHAAGANTETMQTTIATTRQPRNPFDIPELLVNILQNLEPRHLLVASGISRTTHNLVVNHPVLRRCLETAMVPDVGSDFRIPLVGRRQGRYSLVPRKALPVSDTSMIVNETLADLQLVRFERYGAMRYTMGATLELGRVDSKNNIPIQLLKVAGAGRNILLCQPPVHQAKVTLHWNHFDTTHTGQRVARMKYSTDDRDVGFCAEGITLGDLSDAAVQIQREHEQYRKCYVPSERDWSVSAWWRVHIEIREVTAAQPIVASVLRAMAKTNEMAPMLLEWAAEEHHAK